VSYREIATNLCISTPVAEGASGLLFWAELREGHHKKRYFVKQVANCEAAQDERSVNFEHPNFLPLRKECIRIKDTKLTWVLIS